MDPLRMNLLVLSVLVVVSVTLRLPYFYLGVIDWDESTYILIGQSLLDGFRPETDYPLIRGYPYAFFIFLFGKSVEAVRFAGALCVAFAAFFTYLIGVRIWDRATGFLASFYFVFLASLIPSGFSTMSEHIALVPLMASIYVILTRTSISALFVAGILVAIAGLIRLNLAYLAILLGLYLIYIARSDLKKTTANGLAYAFGGMLVLGLSFVPYLLMGQPQLWLSLNFLAGLSYAEFQLTTFQTLATHFRYFISSFFDFRGLSFGLNILVWLGGLAGLIYCFLNWKRDNESTRMALVLLSIGVFGISLSLIKGGAAYPHYLIQLIPFMGLFSAVLIRKLAWSGNNKLKWFTTAILCLVLLISLKPVVGGYLAGVKNYFNKGVLRTGPSYDIANYLKENNPNKEQMFILEKHIVYWLLGARSMSRSTVHPSNMTKKPLLEYIEKIETSTQKEMQKILDKKPGFIVSSDAVPYLKDEPEAVAILNEILASDYQVVHKVKQYKIYKRNTR